MSVSVLETPKAGDEIMIAGSGHLATSPSLHGKILEVWGPPGDQLCSVLWTPGNVTVLPFELARKATTARRASPRAGVLLLGSDANAATAALATTWRELGVKAEVVDASSLLDRVGPNDVVVGRLDLLPTLDGVEPGLLALFLLERRGVRVVNGVESVLGAHDKLRTARLLAHAGLPHPATVAVRRGDRTIRLRPPVVVKPRFGSWGRDVFRCDDEAALAHCLSEVRDRTWFKRHGAIVQEYLPNHGRDLRVVVAGGRVVGAAERVAALGEWRTNVSLGGTLRPAPVPDDAGELARAAAAVIDADFVGVDLFAVDGRGFVVIELNAAVDFDETYSIAGHGAFAEAAAALALSER